MFLGSRYALAASAVKFPLALANLLAFAAIPPVQYSSSAEVKHC